ncbi:hypothetical protein T492DRAFT_842428 [Pavlovales sp. CCMP2436]|nr:hypothetical protein T492DRAFT_842428 [Pavlovales sp. CCMP2436]
MGDGLCGLLAMLLAEPSICRAQLRSCEFFSNTCEAVFALAVRSSLSAPSYFRPLIAQCKELILIVSPLLERTHAAPEVDAAAAEDGPPGGDTKLRKCTQCLRTAYCSVACQRADWTGHKIPCQKSKFIREHFA